MKRYITLILALLIGVNASAQIFVETPRNLLSERSSAQGILFNRDIMSIAEMGTLSQSTFQYGTARSMGLAGAMTSLGGDGSSMLINPAGLGMYRTGEITITPMLTIQSSDSRGGSYSESSGKTSFGLSNFSAAFNLYESGSTKLISLNMGVGYNRVSDLNYEYTVGSANKSSSIANLFSRQMTGENVSLEEVYGEEYPDWSYMPSNIWGAILGYKTGLTYPTSTSTDDTEDPIWTSSWISSSALIDQDLTIKSEGSVGEYDIAIGANIDNKLYLGVTVGIQDVYQRLDLEYGEVYNNNTNLADNRLLYSKYNQTAITSGAGVNLKIGATYRPIEALRLAVAYHSPTWYSLSREYQASMGSSSINASGKTSTVVVDSPLLQDVVLNKWKFRSASKLLLGGSYTFAQRALLSIDYQLDWASNITDRKRPTGVSSTIYDGLSSSYNNTSTLRVGGEYKLNPSFVVRGGYGLSSSMVADDSELWGIPITDKIRYYSVGIGYSPASTVTFDLTYMNQCSELSDYTIFYGTGTLTGDLADSNIPSAASAQSDSFSTKIKQSNIVLSMIFKM